MYVKMPLSWGKNPNTADPKFRQNSAMSADRQESPPTLNCSLKLAMCSSNDRPSGTVSIPDIRVRNSTTASSSGIFRILTYARKSFAQSSSASRLRSVPKRGGKRSMSPAMTLTTGAASLACVVVACVSLAGVGRALLPVRRHRSSVCVGRFRCAAT